MKLSPAGRDFITRHEGLVTQAYRDAAGVWTIGVGHTGRSGGLKPKKGMKITRAKALEIFTADLPPFERRVEAALAVPGSPLAQHAFDGGVSFDFNTGAIHKASWTVYLRARDMRGAQQAFMRWTRAGGRRLKGLVRRRTEEWNLIAYGQYDGRGQGTTRETQTKLKSLGYYRGPVDGRWGVLTDAAVRAFQSANGLVVDGTMGRATIDTLNRKTTERNVAVAAPIAAGTTGSAAMQAAGVAGERGSDLWFWGLTVGGGVLAVIIVGFLLWHYRGAIRAAFTPTKADPA